MSSRTTSFISNLIFLIFINLLVKPFYIFGIDRMVQNEAGNEAYGSYFSIMNASMLFYIVLDLGITEFNRRKVAQNPNFIQDTLGSFIVLKSVLAIFYFLVLGSIAIFNQYNSQETYFLLLLGLNQVLLSGILFFRGVLGGFQMFKVDSFFSVIDRLLLILIAGSILFTPLIDFSIQNFILAQNLAYGLSFLIIFFYVIKKTNKLGFKLPRKRILKIIKGSLPYATIVLAATFYYRIDGVMIKYLLDGKTGDYQAGIYAQGYRLLDATQAFVYLFSTILLPLFANMIRKRENLNPLVKTSLKAILTFSIGVSLVSFTFKHQIIELLYHQSDESGEVFGLLIFTIIFISLVYIFGTLLSAGAKMKHLNWIVVSGAIVNLILNFILIPKYYAYGAALATLISQIIIGVTHLFIGSLQYQIKYKPKYFISIALFSISLFICFNVIKEINPSKFGLLFCLFLVPFVAFITRMIDIKELQKIMMSKIS